MNSRLGLLKRPLILSLNDTPEVRGTFSAAVPATYSVGGGDCKKAVTELIISGP